MESYITPQTYARNGKKVLQEEQLKKLRDKIADIQRDY
jgi:hypothetical protein